MPIEIIGPLVGAGPGLLCLGADRHVFGHDPYLSPTFQHRSTRIVEGPKKVSGFALLMWSWAAAFRFSSLGCFENPLL